MMRTAAGLVALLAGAGALACSLEAARCAHNRPGPRRSRLATRRRKGERESSVHDRVRGRHHSRSRDHDYQRCRQRLRLRVGRLLRTDAERAAVHSYRAASRVKSLSSATARTSRRPRAGGCSCGSTTVTKGSGTIAGRSKCELCIVRRSWLGARGSGLGLARGSGLASRDQGPRVAESVW